MTEQEVFNIAYTYAIPLAKRTNEYAEKEGLSYRTNPTEIAKYLTAIAKKESTFNPKAINKNSTARGLMQILIDTQREIESKHAKVPFAIAMYPSKHFTKAPVLKGNKAMDKLFNPDYSMQLASAYLLYQFRRYKGDWNKAVHSYNQGSYRAENSSGNSYNNSVASNVEKLNVNPNETMAVLNGHYQVLSTDKNDYVYRSGF